MSSYTRVSEQVFPHKVPARAGIGLRYPHYQHVLENRPEVAWFEVHPENFFVEGGAAYQILESVCDHYPLSLHGVGLSLGSASLPDTGHLQKFKKLIDRFQPGLVSDHVSWSRVGSVVMNDLLPVPYTQEALGHLVRNVSHTQEMLGRQILIENPSSYLSYQADEMPEYEFMIEAARRSGCMLLLDVNNIYVAAHNHGLDAVDYINQIPPELVGEIHLAGHSQVEVEGQPLLIDTHSKRVIEVVWSLYEQAIARCGAVPTLIEWDEDIPEFSVLEEEAARAQVVLDGETSVIPEIGKA